MRIIIRLLTILEKSYDYFRITYRKNIELNHLYRQIDLINERINERINEKKAFLE